MSTGSRLPFRHSRTGGGIANASEAAQKSPGAPKIAAIAGPGSYDTPKGKVEASSMMSSRI